MLRSVIYGLGSRSLSPDKFLFAGNGEDLEKGIL